MVRCPNCGSTAQVRENIPFVDYQGNYVDAKYVCGCGVYFDTENDLENLLEANADVLKRLKNI
jgi:C4-type Zn-finger protein